MSNIASTQEAERIRRHVLHTLTAAYGESLTIDRIREHVNRACAALLLTVDRHQLAAATETLARTAVRQDIQRSSTPQVAG